MYLTKKRSLISIVVILCFLATSIVVLGSVGMSSVEAESLEADIPAISAYTTYEIVNYFSKYDVQNCTTDGIIIDLRNQKSSLAMVITFTIPANVNHVIIYGYDTSKDVYAHLSSIMFTNEERDQKTLYFTVDGLKCSGNPNVFKAVDCEYDITFKGKNEIKNYALSGFDEFKPADYFVIYVLNTLRIRTAKGSYTKIVGIDGINGVDGAEGAVGETGRDGVNTNDNTKDGGIGGTGGKGKNGGNAMTNGGIGILAVKINWYLQGTISVTGGNGGNGGTGGKGGQGGTGGRGADDNIKTDGGGKGGQGGTGGEGGDGGKASRGGAATITYYDNTIFGDKNLLTIKDGENGAWGQGGAGGDGGVGGAGGAGGWIDGPGESGDKGKPGNKGKTTMEYITNAIRFEDLFNGNYEFE